MKRWPFRRRDRSTGCADLIHPEGAWIALWVTSPKLYAPGRYMRHASGRGLKSASRQHLYEPVRQVLAVDQALRSMPRTTYADDFVILSRGHAAEALAWIKGVMTRLALTLNEVNTSLRNAQQERIDFLGYSFGPHRYKANGAW
jgi:RNA-directed DNA polymerase